MIYLYGFTIVALILSFYFDRKKTLKALQTAWKTFLKMAPLLGVTLMMVSLVLYFLPSDVIADYLGSSNKLIGTILGTIIGAISLLPGFITFPLSGLLLEQGVSYTVIAAFTTSLMMVGIVTYPMEKSYFGKLAFYRNLFALMTALLIALVVGILYGEVVL